MEGLGGGDWRAEGGKGGGGTGWWEWGVEGRGWGGEDEGEDGKEEEHLHVVEGSDQSEVADLGKTSEVRRVYRRLLHLVGRMSNVHAILATQCRF